MSTGTRMEYHKLAWLLLCWPVLGAAQVPVDGAGEPLGEYESVTEYSTTGNEDIPLLSGTELEELVGPIALYPDDLLAIVLPAAAYPLQIVQAGRFLEDLEDDPSRKPDESWDDSVVALLNYPEVIEMMNDDLDWTWRLGEAVVAQQADVIAAVEAFRDRAYAAGNLKSDERQTVARSDGHIEITPVEDDVIYVPYYEPEHVVVYQPRPVYYYYPRAYPVYYYPYPSHYHFRHGYFWGVTTAFALGWHSHHINVFHHSYYGHPYYGHYYWPRWWYRRPAITVYRDIYVNRRVTRSYDHYRYGDRWLPREHRRTVSLRDNRATRTRYYPSTDTRSVSRSTTLVRPSEVNRSSRNDALRRTETRNDIVRRDTRRDAAQPEIRFRERPAVTTRAGSNRANIRADNDTRIMPNRQRTEAIANDLRRQPPSRQVQTRRSEPRENVSQQVRRSEPRQNVSQQVRRSEPRQNVSRQVRRSEPRQNVSQQVRRSEPRQNVSRQVQRSEPRQSQARRSGERTESKSGARVKSESRRVARNERSRASLRRH